MTGELPDEHVSNLPVPVRGGQLVSWNELSVTEAALVYATRLQLSVLPVREDKTPATPNGVNDATADPLRVRQLFGNTSRAGVAIAGSARLFVLDVDLQHGGIEALTTLTATFGALPPTWTVETPQGGRHYYFASKRAVGCSRGKLPHGLDLRGVGGYAVAVPSTTRWGTYRWSAGCSPGEVELAEAPDWLMSAILGSESLTNDGGASGALELLEGQRNIGLTSIAGHLRRCGLNRAAIAAALHESNAERCRPPLARREVDKIAKSVAGYLSTFDAASPPRSIHSVAFSAIEPEPVKWLWRHRIPLGKLTVIDGDPGLGKSALTVDIAARVSTGLVMPDGTPGIHGRVVFVTFEDDCAATVRPRLDAAGADVSRVFTLPVVEGERLLAVPDDLGAIEQEVVAREAVLLFIDPLMAALGAAVDSHRDQSVRRALAPLAGLAQRTGAAVVVVRHLNKGQSTTALHRGGGSIGIAGAARAVLLVARDPGEPNRRVLATTKSNLGPVSDSLTFETVEAPNGAVMIEWTGMSTQTADELVAAAAAGEDRGAVEEAAEFLSVELAQGPVPAADMRSRATRSGISWASIRRAAERLSVAKKKSAFDGGWEWSLSSSEDAHFHDQEAHHGAVSSLGAAEHLRDGEGEQ